MGHPLTGGGRAPAASVLTPLKAKGIVLADGGARYVVCAIDWCRIENSTYDLFRSRLAAAVGTAPGRVAFQCTHCHESPHVDGGAQRILDRLPSPPLHVDLAFLEATIDRVAMAARESLGRMRRWTHVGCGKGRVEGVASNSRVWMPGGKLVERPSVTPAGPIQDQPEGRIDAWIRTVSFLDGEKPLVRMHYYACHPENTKTNGKVSSDIFGPLRERLEREEGIPQIYFAGCGGDVGMGKYHIEPAEACAVRAIDRIVAGIHEARATARREAVTRIDWKVAEARLVSREFDESGLRGRLEDPSQPEKNRVGAARTLAWCERMAKKPTVEVPCLRLGTVSVVHLPGEPFVEYQLFAQSASSGFVAVAGYGDGGPGYVCTDQGYAEGGYQPSASKVGPGTEAGLKAAIVEVLR